MQDDKLANLANAITENNITFCCIQETWLSGNTLNQIKVSKDLKPAQCFFFHHGQLVQKGCGSGGVGTLLGPKGKTAWQLAGSPEPVRGNLINGSARVISLEIHVLDNCKKLLKYFIVSAYHSNSDHDCSGNKQLELLKTLNPVYSCALSNGIIVLGEDINAKLGRNLWKENEDVSSVTTFFVKQVQKQNSNREAQPKQSPNGPNTRIASNKRTSQ
eukprot:14687927-Ditylum_brightwellii.AAC.1